MKKLIVLLTALFLIILGVGLTNASTLDFEGQGFGDGTQILESGYGGFKWSTYIYSYTVTSYNSGYQNAGYHSALPSLSSTC